MRTWLLLASVLLLTPLMVFAQENTSTAFVPLTSIPGIESAGNAQGLPDFLNSLYRLAIGAAAVLAVLQIVRAGIMYMGGDSVTEKKEAKSLIALSIGGLILILSPVVVFSIINPDILSLKIGNLDKLTKTEFEAYQPGQEIGAGGGSGQCSSYTAVSAVPESPGCATTANTADGFEKVADSCCAGLAAGKVCCGSKTIKPAAAPAATTPQSCQVTYSLVQARASACSSGYEVADNACCSSVGTGQKCCGKKKTTTTTQPAPIKWGWRMALVRASDGGGQSTHFQGPFTTQTLCQDSLTKYQADKGLIVADAVPQCSCAKPLSEQPGCGNI